MERKILLSIMMAFLVSCSQGGFVEPIASTISKPETTYIPVMPTKTRVGQYDVFDGVSSISNLVLKVDGDKAETSLTGIVTIQPVDGDQIALKVPINVVGTISPDDFTSYMFVQNQAELDSLQVKAGAKLTCMYTDCSESFIDIYVVYKGRAYHHQVESTDKMIVKPNPSAKDEDSQVEEDSDDQGGKQSSTPDKPKVKKKTKPTPTPTPEEEEKLDEEGSEFEHDDDGGGELGAYVGEPERDIEVLFQVAPSTPTPTPKEDKKEEEKKDEKKDDKKSNSQQPAPVNPKKDEPKKEEPKKPEPKKEEPKKPVTPVVPKPPIKPDVPSKNPDNVSVGRKILNTISQAIGDNGTGRLENAVSLLKFQKDNDNSGYNIMYPKRETYYGTTDMLNMMAHIGQYSQKKVNGYIISVGDVSKKNGGKLGGHSSHRRGLDADISYYFDNNSFQKGFTNVMASSSAKRSWMSDTQWDLFKSLVETSNVDRIFTDSNMKREFCQIAARNKEVGSSKDGVPFETLRALVPWKGHANHFHLRLKCSKGQPRCRQMAPPARATGC
ncbi:penicillin-insensitive murein endopeptidase [Bdellovibrio sp. HCB337]|uniref:penicillin-insensitive murein endopeptidase n=1 Tax=Bdellovibrio sp. HCB337 TaxID=3394358 RepID=UPI0039A4B50A